MYSEFRKFIKISQMHMFTIMGCHNTLHDDTHHNDSYHKGPNSNIENNVIVMLCHYPKVI